MANNKITAVEKIYNKFEHLEYILSQYKVTLEGLAVRYDKVKAIYDDNYRLYQDVKNRNCNLRYSDFLELSEEQVKEEDELDIKLDKSLFKVNVCEKAFDSAVKSMFETISKEDFCL